MPNLLKVILVHIFILFCFCSNPVDSDNTTDSTATQKPVYFGVISQNITFHVTDSIAVILGVDGSIDFNLIATDGMQIYYNSSGTPYKVGNVRIYYNSAGNPYKVGDIQTYYSSTTGQPYKIDDVRIYYNSSSKPYKIGDAQIYYNSDGNIYKIDGQVN